jgi:hypothetical protein
LDGRRTFNGEVSIHFPGLDGLDKAKHVRVPKFGHRRGFRNLLRKQL